MGNIFSPTTTLEHLKTLLWMMRVFSLLFVNIKISVICERNLFSLSDMTSCRKMLTEVIGVRTGKYSLGETDTSKALNAGTCRKVLFLLIKIYKGDREPFTPSCCFGQKTKLLRTETNVSEIFTLKHFAALLSSHFRRKQEVREGFLPFWNQRM